MEIRSYLESAVKCEPFSLFPPVKMLDAAPLPALAKPILPTVPLISAKLKGNSINRTYMPVPAARCVYKKS